MKRLLKLRETPTFFRWIQKVPIRNYSTSNLAQPSAQMAEIDHTQLINSVSNYSQMRQILSHMIINAIPIDKFFLMKLIEVSASSTGFRSSSLLFTQFDKFIDSDLCNSIIRCYNDVSKHLHSVFVYTQMRKIGIFIDSSTFPSVLKAVSQLCHRTFGKWVHCSVIQMGFESDVYVGTALVTMYSACFLIGDARNVFDGMSLRNSVSWNALITGYIHNREFRQAIDVFRDMQNAGVEPGEVTAVGVLSACAHLGALTQGQWVHDYIKQKRLRLNVYVGTALIDMYAKCGLVEEAEKVFQAMRRKNDYTWNVLIYGYAISGEGEAALRLFSTMLAENFRPDNITFLGVLCACCYQGLVDEGKRLFKRMQEEFGLQPRIEHYGCMVDLLGRTGYLDEAQDIIHSMSVKPDPVIWRALLGACRIHKNTQVGEFAIKKLLELEPSNGENYVLLANLYARDQRWTEAGEVRKVMDHKGIYKVPGCSSIEVNDVVYEFVASDVIEPGLEDVYRLLADINKDLKLAGYVVGTDIALYDVEEEEKEHSLMHHSEKLALVFGLLKSPAYSTLRIIKNLRVCHDCHEFFKIVSKVYKRDISLRDRNRFHKFAEGNCSCRDFW